MMNQSVAKMLFPGQSALNRTLRWTDPVMKFIGISPEPRRIIGVVPDVDDENIIPSPSMTVYEPSDQEGWQGRLFVRTDLLPAGLYPSSPARFTTWPKTSRWSEPAHSKIFARKFSPPTV